MRAKWLAIGLLYLLVLGHSSPERFLRAHEQWSSSHTFKWKVSTEEQYDRSVENEISQLPPDVQAQLQRQSVRFNFNKRQTQAYLIIQRSPAAAIVEFEIIESTYLPKQTVRFLCADDFLIITTPLHYRSPSAQDEPTSTIRASIFRVQEKSLFLGIPTFFSGIGAEINMFHPAFHAAAYPLKVKAPLGWMGYNQIRWLYDNKESTVLLLQVEQNIVGTMQLSKQHGYAPLLLVIQHGNTRHKWATRQWKQVSGYWIPSLVEYEYSSKTVTQRAKFELVSVEPSTSIDASQFVPVGSTVTDYRLKGSMTDSPPRSLDKIVTYHYTGRILTIDELEKIAYQQGNLIPSETPRRRYSLLLFLPALLFFALAAYFYFRNKRR